MDDLALETFDDGIDELTDAIHAGFDAIPLPEDVEPYRSTPFAFALRNEQGRIEGGVTGHSVWGWLYVHYLWVAETRRRGGHGKRLLQVAESEAERRGCHGVWLHTISFQAPAFYEHMGYRRCGGLDDFPKGHQRIFYQKRLIPDPG
ncbi:MAG: GNAT family N-acetyltransferase [Geminicoccaceae bacterium]